MAMTLGPTPPDIDDWRLAALKALASPTDTMIDAAHEAVWFDAYWAINSRSDFKRAVKAMIAAALAEPDQQDR